MTEPLTDHPKRGRVPHVVGVAVVAALLLFAAACTPQAHAQDLLNADRNAHGLPSLPSHADLYNKAQSWAEQMARNGSISHSNLTQGLPAGWRYAGENVGCGTTLEGIEQSFMNSAGHRANILSTRFTHVASGVATGRCVTSSGFVIQNAYFVAQVFVQL